MKVGLEAKKDETLTNKEMLLRKQIMVVSEKVCKPIFFLSLYLETLK